MATWTYEEALRRLLLHEGGYTNHPADPGGPTNFGITLADYRRYVKPDATADDVRAMKVEEAKAIYRSRYWDAMRCDELPAGVDYCIFDYAANSGTGRAPKVLQRLLGAPVTGEIDDATVRFSRVHDARTLVAAICDERLRFLQGLKTWPVFGKGWGRSVAEVRAAALAMVAGPKTSPFTPAQAPPPVAGTPPWLVRMNAILGLYEFAGAADNPVILAMAKACGGKIARDYKHDSVPWCALTVNYCLLASGFPGNDSLWALDFGKYGVRLDGPAVGAIACKRRDGGGHVFLVVGRDREGRIVGRGGNQSDMVCDEIFDPAAIVSYSWPREFPRTDQVGGSRLPVVTPEPRAKRQVALPPPRRAPAKGVVPGNDSAGKTAAGGAIVAGGVAAAQASEPATILVIVGATVAVAAGVWFFWRWWQRRRQDAKA